MSLIQGKILFPMTRPTMCVKVSCSIKCKTEEDLTNELAIYIESKNEKQKPHSLYFAIM